MGVRLETMPDDWESATGDRRPPTRLGVRGGQRRRSMDSRPSAASADEARIAGKLFSMRPADPRLNDAAWLSRKRSQRWSVTRLATLLGVDHKVVSAALRRARLPVPLPPTSPYPQLHDPAWLTDALAEYCVEDVARMVRCAPQSVRYACRKYGVLCPINGHDPPEEVAARLADHNWLAGCRAVGASIRRLADELGVGPDRVAAAIHAADLPPVGRNGSRPSFPDLYDVDWVRAQLATKCRTQVAAELGCSSGAKYRVGVGRGGR